MSDLRQRLSLAARYHQTGQLREAEAFYRSILAEAPSHVHALHLLGVLAHQTGRSREAIELMQRALAASGPQAALLSNLSAAYLAADRLSEAADSARAAIRSDPQLADAHNNLGVALRRQGKLAEAETAFRTAVTLNSGHVDARTNLGAALQQQGNTTDALVHLNEALRLAPGNFHVHNDLGGALIAARRYDEALNHLRQAILIKPDFAEAHNNLGVALLNLNRFEESREAFAKAVAINPDYVRARINVGHALQLLGRIDEAVTAYLDVLGREPRNALALSYLSNLAAHGFFRLTPEQMQLVEEIAGNANAPPEDLWRLHFALGRLRDKAGRYDEAFAAVVRGNELRRHEDRRRGIMFDPAAHRERIDQLIAGYTTDYFAGVAGVGSNSELPIFVVGMMRSGTTLVEQILASHPRVHGAGELPDIQRLVGKLVSGEWSVVSGGLVRGEWSVVSGPEAKGATTHNSPLTTHQSTIHQPDYSPTTITPDCLNRLDRATVETFAKRYLATLRQRGGDAERVVDKMPANFLHLGLIATLFPRARIIHCRRDPRDTCLSCFFQNFTDPNPFAFDLRHLGLYYREYSRLMDHWTRVLPVPIFHLQYEELIQHQEAITRRLLDFCGLDWDERCLRFNETNRPVRTASALQVRQPLYASSVGRWRHYAAHLRPLLEVLEDDTGEEPVA